MDNLEQKVIKQEMSDVVLEAKNAPNTVVNVSFGERYRINEIPVKVKGCWEQNKHCLCCLFILLTGITVLCLYLYVGAGVNSDSGTTQLQYNVTTDEQVQSTPGPSKTPFPSHSPTSTPTPTRSPVSATPSPSPSASPSRSIIPDEGVFGKDTIILTSGGTMLIITLLCVFACWWKIRKNKKEMNVQPLESPVK